MTDFTAYIDLYCERTAIGFFNEPFNAFSNLSLLLAACWNLYRALHEPSNRWFWCLCAMAGLIGVGSFAFHTRPSLITQWMDVVPIWLFVSSLTLSYIHLVSGQRFFVTMGIGCVGAIVLTLLFYFSKGTITAQPPGDEVRAFNGSLQYLPAVLALAVFSVLTTAVNHVSKLYFWSATFFFSAALAARTIDIHTCSIFPLGTHFLWHLFVGLTAGVLLRGFAVSQRVSN